MTSTQEVYTRIQNLKHIDFSATQPQPETAGQDYQRRMAGLMDNRPYPQVRMDVEIYKSMLAEQRWTTAQMDAAVRELSPIAAQAGRNQNYIQYLRERAKALLVEERKRLERYKAELRDERDRNADEAYRYYKAQIRENFTLPYAPRMDEIIMTAMLAEGFLAAEIVAAVDALSPLREGQSNYGLSLFRHMETSEKAEIVKAEGPEEPTQELAPQRVLDMPRPLPAEETGVTA